MSENSCVRLSFYFILHQLLIAMCAAVLKKIARTELKMLKEKQTDFSRNFMIKKTNLLKLQQNGSQNVPCTFLYCNFVSKWRFMQPFGSKSRKTKQKC